MPDGRAPHDLQTLADELDKGFDGLETNFDPAARLDDLKYARDRIEGLVPKVLAAAETFHSYVSAGVLKRPPVRDVRDAVTRALQLLESNSLDREKCDHFCRDLREFVNTSESLLLEAWQTFVDGRFARRELPFMRLLCQSFIDMKGAGQRERDEAEKGLSLSKELEDARSRVPGQDATRVRGQVIRVAKIAGDLAKVRDTLIGSDPDVKNFVRSIAHDGSVNLGAIPDSVWKWIAEKGLTAAYVVTPATGGANRT